MNILQLMKLKGCSIVNQLYNNGYGGRVIFWFRYCINCNDLNDRISLINACKEGKCRKIIFETYGDLCNNGLYMQQMLINLKHY